MQFWSPHLQEDAAELEKGKWRKSGGWSCCFISRYSESWDASVWRGEGSGEMKERCEKHEGGGISVKNLLYMNQGKLPEIRTCWFRTDQRKYFAHCLSGSSDSTVQNSSMCPPLEKIFPLPVPKSNVTPIFFKFLL